MGLFQRKKAAFSTSTLLHISAIKAFFRAVGLESLVLVRQLMRSNTKIEGKKPAIKNSFLIALGKCGVHFLPAAASITMLYINIKGYWIGAQMVAMHGESSVSIALLQLVAKMQELLIVASLATALFDILRFELLYGSGIPLGLLGSGITFTQISYFRSPDFLGALRYGISEKKKKKLCVCVALLLAGLLATTAGPASAILMIPRQQAWAAGTLDFYLNGTNNDFWPSQLTYEGQLQDWDISDCRNFKATSTAVCPAGGYHSLWDHFTASTIYNVNDVLYEVNNPDTRQVRMDIDSPLGYVPTHTISGNIRGLSLETWMYTTHAATDRLQKLLNDVWQSETFQMRYSALHDRSRYEFFSTSTSTLRTQVPVVRVGCAPGQNLSEGQTTIEFPVVPPFDYWINTTNLSLPEILLNARRRDHAKITWVELPPDFGATTAGALVELPWDTYTSTRVAFGCSIDARWTDGIISYDGQAPHEAHILHTRPSKRDKEYLPDSNHWRRIAVDADWLAALTPPVPRTGPGYEPWDPSTIQSIFYATGLTTCAFSQKNLSAHNQTYNWNHHSPSAITFTEYVLAIVFADGLSRVGSFRAFNTTVSPITSWPVQNYTNILDDRNLSSILLRGGQQVLLPAFPSNQFTRLRMEEHIYGYCYKSSSASDYLAIAVLLTHLIIALSHTVWILYRREASGCWDTVTELITLSQNSRPAPTALRNTCAGIKELNTFGQVARINVTESANGSDDHLELVFDEGTKEGSHQTTTTPAKAVAVSFGALSRRAVKSGDLYGGL